MCNHLFANHLGKEDGSEEGKLVPALVFLQLTILLITCSFALFLCIC